jgi:hypothetical protein
MEELKKQPKVNLPIFMFLFNQRRHFKSSLNLVPRPLRPGDELGELLGDQLGRVGLRKMKQSFCLNLKDIEHLTNSAIVFYSYVQYEANMYMYFYPATINI